MVGGLTGFLLYDSGILMWNAIDIKINHLFRTYLKFCFLHSLEQLIARPARVKL